MTLAYDDAILLRRQGEEGGGTCVRARRGTDLEFGFSREACICVRVERADEDGSEVRQCESDLQRERERGEGGERGWKGGV